MKRQRCRTWVEVFLFCGFAAMSLAVTAQAPEAGRTPESGSPTSEKVERPRTTGEIEILQPQYLPSNKNISRQARFLHRVEQLQSSQTPRLTGTGVTVAVWDGGLIRRSHPDFSALQVVDNRDSEHEELFLSNHATHVGGTIAGSGRHLEAALGMAPGTRLLSFDFANDLQEMAKLSVDEVQVSNHSYSSIAGWSDVCNILGKLWWVWAGPESSEEDPLFGRYTAYSEAFDRLATASPAWTRVVAAGNARGPILDPHNAALELPGNALFEGIAHRDLSFSGRHLLGNCKGTSSEAPHPSNRSRGGGFDTLPGGLATAKNVLTIGAQADPRDAWDPVKKSFKEARLDDIRTTAFSSWGPTDDGRIKPDVIANGDSLIAPAIPRPCLEKPCKPADVEGLDSDYVQMSGTSMAAPVASGILALLNELSRRLRDGAPLRADEAKALLIHTALSPDLGPRYDIGWGTIQADTAGQVLARKTAGESLTTLTLKRAEVRKVRLRRATLRPGRITLSWLDPPATAAAEGEANDRALVNDIDLRLIPPKEGAAAVLPWTLDPSRPSRAAERGVNDRDNVERIDLPEALSSDGEWILEIESKDWPDTEEQSAALALWGFEEVTP